MLNSSESSSRPTTTGSNPSLSKDEAVSPVSRKGERANPFAKPNPNASLHSSSIAPSPWKASSLPPLDSSISSADDFPFSYDIRDDHIDDFSSLLDTLGSSDKEEPFDPNPSKAPSYYMNCLLYTSPSPRD